MKAPWANVALLVMMSTLTISGYLGLVSGQERAAWRLWLHGIAAYGLVVLFIWKSTIILDAYRRKNKWTGQRIMFTILLIMLLLTVAMGLLWTFKGPLFLRGFSLVSLHIYIAVPLMLMMAYHAWQHRFIFRVKGSLNKRLFLGLITTAVLGVAFRQSTKMFQEMLNWAGSSRRFTGSYERGSFTAHFPEVSWIADNPPPLSVSSWRLLVHGAVHKSITLTFGDLEAMPLSKFDAVLDCTGGWYTRQVWEGVTLKDILMRAGLVETAVSVTVESVTKYRRRFSLAEAEHMLLAYRVAGMPLTHGHGAPLRLVHPEKRGVDWVKWITVIEVNTTSARLQSPLPLP